MSWHRVTFRQIQPIHIGYKKHGVINETRIFITGQMMWGALTNAYFHKTKEYNKILFENISCFYPIVRDKVLLPKFKNGEFYLGDLSEKEFRQEFVTTLLSTAINPTTKNAKDESLHEIDVIVPKDICWVGYVKCDKEKLEELKEIYVGADSRYGFGLMRLESIEEKSYTQKPQKGIIEEFQPNEPLTNFIKFANQKFEGRLELLAEFQFEENIPKVVNGDLYICVGSKILE